VSVTKIDEMAERYDLADDTFQRRQRVHDWRSHVGDELQEIWPELTQRERLLIALTAQRGADAEEWD
jgi:hypothetical protein